MIDASNNVRDPNPGSCQPHATAVFVIRNEDAKPHLVRVPRARFEPRGSAPAEPFEPLGDDFVVVDAKGRGIIQLKAKAAAFFEKTKNPSYKYTVLWSNPDGSGEKELDPDFEINS